MKSCLNYPYTAIFAIFLSSRLFVVFTVSHINVSSDSEEYLTLARSLRTDHSFSREGIPETYRMPGYPLFLSIIPSMESPRVIAVAQAVLFSIEAMLIYHLALCLFGNGPAVVAMLLLFFDPSNLLATISVLSESLFTFCLVLTVWVWSFKSHRYAPIQAIVIGILCGTLCLIRPITVWLFVPVTLAFISRKDNGWNFALCAGLFLLGIGVTQGSWIVRNYCHYGTFYMTEIPSAAMYVYWTQAVIAEETGQNAETLYERAWKEWDDERNRRNPVEMKNHFRDKSLKIIRPHLPSVIKIFFKGLIRLHVDSGVSKLAGFYPGNLPLSMGELKNSILHPKGLPSIMTASGIVFLRLMELFGILAVSIGAAVTCLRSVHTRNRANLNSGTILFAAILIAYLVLLSSSPAANVRFREQYFSLAILLASPAIYSLGVSLFHK